MNELLSAMVQASMAAEKGDCATCKDKDTCELLYLHNHPELTDIEAIAGVGNFIYPLTAELGARVANLVTFCLTTRDEYLVAAALEALLDVGSLATSMSKLMRLLVEKEGA